MKLFFKKFHGAGNDFVIINPVGKSPFSRDLIASICSRKRGVGADGLILIGKKDNTGNFPFKYFNSDGSRANFCGNGLRCAVLSCHLLTGLKRISLNTDAGRLSTWVISKNKIRIEAPVDSPPKRIRVKGFKSAFFCVIGVPHVVILVDNLATVDLVRIGRKIRNSNAFSPNGTNVNFVQITSRNSISIRTYERGVEDETEACGSGACAAALCLANFAKLQFPIQVKTSYGDILEIAVPKYENGAKTTEKLYLTGPAKMAFSGEIDS